MAIKLVDAGVNVQAQAGSFPTFSAITGLANGDTIHVVDNGPVMVTTMYNIQRHNLTITSWPQNRNMPEIRIQTGGTSTVGFQNYGYLNTVFSNLKIVTHDTATTISLGLAANYCKITGCHIINDYGTGYNISLFLGWGGTENEISNCVLELSGSVNALKCVNARIINNTFKKVGNVNTQFFIRCAERYASGYNQLIYNNIFDGSGKVQVPFIKGDNLVPSGIADYNCLIGLTVMMLDDHWNYGAGFHSIIGDPLFTNAAAHDFTLQSGSPCIDIGASTAFNAKIPTSDIIKNPRGDGNGLWDIGAYEYTVLNYVDIITSPTIDTYEDSLYSYYPIADYLGETGVQWTLSGAPTGMSLDTSTGVTGVISWTPTTGGYQTDEITLSITDGTVYDEQKWNVNVLEVNDKPLITSVPSKYVEYGSTYYYQATAIDEETSMENLKWRVIGGPAGINVSESTGLVSWNPTTPGIISDIITLEVRDAGDLIDTQQWSITVMPIITGQVFVEGEANGTMNISPSMVTISSIFSDPSSFLVEVLPGTGYRVIPSDTVDSGNLPKIHIEKASYPVCYVNVRAYNYAGVLSNSYPLLINTVNKGNNKEVTQPPVFVKGKNKS